MAELAEYTIDPVHLERLHSLAVKLAAYLNGFERPIASFVDSLETLDFVHNTN